jgi:hypothetical protein
MRVKGFEKSSMDKLEQTINKWLEENLNAEVIDIKYAYGRGISDVFSALIIYKEF